jgi:serine/threonine protein kinase/tetratricopeptide (TPR) repeat protein
MSEPSLSAGATFGHFVIADRLGAGGMGEVYQARDVRLGRDVALKLLRPSSVNDPDATERFLREARAASALNHPNVVTVFDIGRGDRGWYIAMELVRGRTLGKLVGTSIDIRTIAGLGAQAARALSVAHEASIVHRDIKPENLMLRDDGYLKVLDFGLARLFELEGSPGANSGSWKTETGLIMGTLRYFSPEQAGGERLGGSSDIFSLGIVLYELLTGAHPFPGTSAMAVMGSILARAPKPLIDGRADTPPAMIALVERMLEKESAARPTAAQVASTLEALAATPLGEPFPIDVQPLAQPTISIRPSAISSRSGISSSALATYHPPRQSTAPAMVGREHDRAQLRETWSRALDGHGQLVGVAGEPGVGKTTFVDAMLSEIASQTNVVIARGRCSERLAGTEAFLPILEALESAVRSDPTGEVTRVLRKQAPTWYRELADATSVDPTQSTGEVPQGLQAASPERMKREIVGFLEATTRTRPVALLIEDLHWADVSTVDLLTYLGGRLDVLPLLVLTTYRPTEMRLAKHPFLPALLDLQSRGLGTELPLDLLDRRAIDDLLAQRYPGHRFPDAFATMLHAQTEGSPLFLVDLLRWLGARGSIADFDGAWQLVGTMPEVSRDLPPSVRGMIQRKIEQLEESDRRLLMAASVQGFTFDSTIVADVLSMDAADVEERLTTLDKVYAFVRAVGEHELPDRSLAMRYRFVHVLYQNALYGALPTSRRISLSAQVAAALETRHAAHVGELATELGALWEAARQPDKASGYYALGATRAAEKFAYAESAELAARGLAQIALLPEGPMRTTLELGLRVSLGFTNVVTRGFHAPETYEQMSRAHELSLTTGRTPQRVPVLWGMVVYHIASGQSPRAYEYAEQMLAIAYEAGDPMLQAMAESAMSGAALFRGELALSMASQARAEVLATPDVRAAMRAIVGSDPLMLSRCQSARAHWMSGDEAGAREIFDRSLVEMKASRDPRERAHVALHLAEFETAMARPEAAERVASEALRICEEYGVASETLWTAAYLGDAQLRLGKRAEGIGTLEHAVSTLLQFQCLVSTAEYHGFMAEGYLALGRVADARRAIDEGFAIVERTGEIVWAPELHRIHALVMQAEDTSTPAAVDAAIARAIALSEGMGAQLWAARARGHSTPGAVSH